MSLSPLLEPLQLRLKLLRLVKAESKNLSSLLQHQRYGRSRLSRSEPQFFLLLNGIFVEQPRETKPNIIYFDYIHTINQNINNI